MVEVVCLGNPLLDIQVRTTPEYLEKYGLKSNDAILADEKHSEIYPEIMKNPDVLLVAGGAAQNTARGVAYILPAKQVAYFGSVGKDIYSEKLLEANEAAGVLTKYEYQTEFHTGKCAVLLTGNDRSLVTDLNAANHFHAAHLKKPENWELVEKAKVFYVGGFHFTVCVEAIQLLGEHATASNKLFGVNLSAPFVCSFFKDAIDSTSKYWDYLICNESEAAAYAEAHELAITDLEEIAKHIALLPKANTDKPRFVIITHGLEDTIVAVADLKTKEVKTSKHPVVKLDQNLIKDTNGAGDAFAGGFVAALAEGKDINTAVAQGQWLASLGIQQDGASYPKERQQFKQ